MGADLQIKRVLIYRLGSMGDTVIALPCLHMIAQAFPLSKRTLLTNFAVTSKAASAAAIIGESGLIQEYMRYTAGSRNPMELASLWWKIRGLRADLLIYLMPIRSESAVRRDVRFFRSAGIRRMVGIPTASTSQNELNERDGLYESEASRLARTLLSLGDAKPNDLGNWDLRLTKSEEGSADEALSDLSRPLIACAPGTKRQANDWGKDNWCSLLRRLSMELPRHSLVLLGSNEDRDICDEVSRAWATRSLNLCGKTSPRVTAGVIARADMYLGPDSGPMHIAAAVGVPIASPFSARNYPGIWYPTGSNNQVIYHKTECFGCRLEACYEKKKECINSITVDEMYGAALRVLVSRNEPRVVPHSQAIRELPYPPLP